jgi:3-oxoacyl-[acyl-carrier-protein] synthase II
MRVLPPPAYARRRVVVTGIGMVTPLGVGMAPTWRALLEGGSGVRELPAGLLGGALPVRVAAIVRRGGDGGFEPADVLDRASARTGSPEFIAFALASAREALVHCGLLPEDALHTPCGSAGGPLASAPLGRYSRARIGVSIGSGIGGVEEVGTTASALFGAPGLRSVSPFFIPRILTNMAAGGCAIAFGLRGPNLAPASACASGAHAIGDAARLIALGAADVMLAGGAEACVGGVALAGFARAKALSLQADPSSASRPFDDGRDGFVLGEGAAVLVLESAEHAAARGAHVWAEVRGVGMSGDAHHVTSPPPDGEGALAAMVAALADGGVSAGEVAYINAHATGTPVGDAVEAIAIGRLLGSGLTHGRLTSPTTTAVASTKGALGHCLGAAGAVEAALTVLSIAHGVVPGTANLTTPDAALPVDVAHFPAVSTAWTVPVALSNSFGFGGTNCSLLFTGGGGGR